jgi:hypothetical protein
VGGWGCSTHSTPPQVSYLTPWWLPTIGSLGEALGVYIGIAAAG